MISSSVSYVPRASILNALRSLNDQTTNLYKEFGFGIAPNEDAHPLMILPIWTIVDLFSNDK